MKATIIGCGEAFEENYPNTSILVDGSLKILLDCGYSVPPAIWRAGITGNDLDLIYISHAHADHYFGLPALLGRMWEDGRTKPLTILSQQLVLDQIRDILEYGYRTLAKRFQYPLHLQAAGPFETSGLRFSFAPTTHAVTNWAIRIDRDGAAIVYSGDGMFTDESRALMRGADLVIHEAFSMQPSAVHADIPSLIGMAEAEDVKKLALVHVQRSLRSSPSPISAAIRPARIPIVMPVPGDTIIV
jgi:ribonuclease BN (tRNA processing enzyme)